MEPRRVLIVANKTALGAHLRGAVVSILHRGPATFVLLVPSLLPDGGLVWNEATVWKAAETRAAEAVALLRGVGAEVTGRVGAHLPYNAVMDMLRETPFDEVLLSTLPPHLSSWIDSGLPDRLRAECGLPLTHLTFDPAAPPPATGEMPVHPA